MGTCTFSGGGVRKASSPLEPQPQMNRRGQGQDPPIQSRASRKIAPSELTRMARVEPSKWHTKGFIPFYAESLVLGHQWNRVCRLRVSGSWARTRHRSATTSIISSRSRKYRLATASFTKGHTRSTGWSSGE
jgi:hypothetical protein